MHSVRLADSFPFDSAGNRSAASIMMIAMTTNNSMRVKARSSLYWAIVFIRLSFLPFKIELCEATADFLQVADRHSAIRISRGKKITLGVEACELGPGHIDPDAHNG